MITLTYFCENCSQYLDVPANLTLEEVKLMNNEDFPIEECPFCGHTMSFDNAY